MEVCSDLGPHAALDVIPTHTLFGNQLFTLTAMFPHNLTRELQMQAPDRMPTYQAKRDPHRDFLELGTIRNVGCICLGASLGLRAA